MSHRVKESRAALRTLRADLKHAKKMLIELVSSYEDERCVEALNSVEDAYARATEILGWRTKDFMEQQREDSCDEYS